MRARARANLCNNSGETEEVFYFTDFTKSCSSYSLKLLFKKRVEICKRCKTSLMVTIMIFKQCPLSFNNFFFNIFRGKISIKQGQISRGKRHQAVSTTLTSGIVDIQNEHLFWSQKSQTFASIFRVNATHFTQHTPLIHTLITCFRSHRTQT